MALRRSANENGNFIDHTKQTPMRLFKDRNCERSNIAAEVEQTIPRVKKI